MTENRQYQEMLDGARRRIRKIDIYEAAALAGLAYDRAAGSITFVTFGSRYRLNTATLETDPPMEMWHHLAVLQYLEGVDRSRPSNVWIGMGDLCDGGLVRGASFDREIDRLIENRLGKLDPDKIMDACRTMDASFETDSPADLCAVFHFMPGYPLRLNLWYADEEFPASGKVLVNKAVQHCLGTEAIGTIAALLVNKLCDLCKG